MRRTSVYLLCLGILLMVGGFIYDAIFAGLPYQDPTPEMAANYAWHSHVAATFYEAGFIAIAGGVVWMLAALIRR